MGTSERKARRVTTHALDEIRRGAGFRSRKLVTGPGAPLDPFVSFEHFHMREPTFPPHPHAGVSAVTYLLERSEGALLSRESSGEARRIDPGGLRWMEAARGMMHEESPFARGRDCHGVQILVNLAAADKEGAPRVLHLERQEIREVTPRRGARVRVVCGEAYGIRSTITPRSPVTLLDVRLSPGASLTPVVAEDHAAFVVPIDGDGELGVADAVVHVDAQVAAVVSAGDGAATVRAGARGFHLLLAMGKPLGEAVVFEGPFVMTSHADIAAAWARHAAGEMGRLAPSAEAATSEVA
jgi:redox-sensitive bicupin YhaK (pirin superfamily)